RSYVTIAERSFRITWARQSLIVPKRRAPRGWRSRTPGPYRMKKSMPRWRMRRWSVLAQTGRDGSSLIAPRLPWPPRPCPRRGRGIYRRMRALWLEDRRLRVWDDVAVAVSSLGEALVRVVGAGS